MAYATKYQFSFVSDNGTDYTINIKKNGYSGSVISRNLGRGPVLKRESGQNGICGTSLEIYAECQTDQEFAEFYTSDPFEFKVELNRVVSNTSTLIWSGSVSPELYSEPDIAPPYDVQIIATDGLGELKMHNWAGVGRKSLRDNLKELLSFTGVTPNYNEMVFISSVAATTPAISAATLWSGLYANLDYLEGESCYDVLTKLLNTFNMSLTRDNNKWLFVRETDVIATNNVIVAHDASGTAVNITPVAYGSMSSHQWWPVGQLSTTVISAKNPNTTTLAYQPYKSFFSNPDITSTEDATTATNWTISGTVVWKKLFDGAIRPVLGYGQTSGTHSISQAVAIHQHNDLITLKIPAVAYSTYQGGIWPWQNKHKLKVTVTVTTGGTTYYLNELSFGDGSEWATTQKRLEWKQDTYFVSDVSALPLDGMPEVEIQIPGIPGDGTLTITLYDDDVSNMGHFVIGGVYFTCEVPTGYKDTVTAANVSAREADDSHEIYIADGPISNNSVLAVANIFTNSGNDITSQWRSALMTGRSFLDLMATDYAACNVLPRLQMEGAMNIPLNSSVPPVMIEPNSNLVVVRTFSWNLLSDEANLTMITAPAVTI